MKITFYGAAGRVTGSKHLVTTIHEERILLDCGMFQGEGAEGDLLNRHFGFDPRTVNYVILSHAHIDHIGLLPRLVREGFSGPVYANASTKDLCRLMLEDSAHIQETDLKRINVRRKEKGLPALDPMYDVNDVRKVMALMEIVPTGKPFVVGRDTEVILTRNAHILGSVAIHLTGTNAEGEKVRLAFSGDIGRPGDAILSGPDPFPQSDYIICESTYGDRRHPEAEDAMQKLLEVVLKTCVEQRGKIIIPAFSVGRTQEIVYHLDRLSYEGKLPPIKVYVDSPLSIEATEVIGRHRDEYNREILEYITRDGDPFDFPNLHYITKVEESKAINDEDEPSIIISASGMAEAGRIKHHIANNVEDARNTILLVGYATPESLAGRLKAGLPMVRIFGQEFQVRASVENMPNFSAHADYVEMMQYLSCQNKHKVREVFLVHGNEKALAAWKSRLMDDGFSKVTIAKMEMSVDLL
ncbi:MAG: MBL fold metallo-hydrolase [Bacteroidetes bacterium]|nr:MBL fold metallo-hydrolase [Bacteroidota bacterium]